MTKHDFQFDTVGKRMPYTAPDGFINSMQQNILNEIAKEPTTDEQNGTMHIVKRSFFTRKRALWAAAAVGIIAVAMTFGLHFQQSSVNKSIDVETAYNNLCEEDQAFLAEIYADDVFMYSE